MFQLINKITCCGKTRLVLLAASLILSVSNYAQVTNNSLSGLEWQIDNNLTVYSKSIQQLSVENKNAPDPQSQNIEYSSVYLPLDWKGNGKFKILKQ